MNERFTLFLTLAVLIAITLVLTPSYYITKIRLDSLQKEAILKGHAEWRLNEDDQRIKQFAFK